MNATPGKGECYELNPSPSQVQPSPVPEGGAGALPGALPGGGRVRAGALGDMQRTTSSFKSWLLLALILCVSLPALLVHLDQPDVVAPHEAKVVLRSFQTWERWAQLTAERGWSVDALIPYVHGRPSLHQPPGVTWQHMIALTGLSSKHCHTEDMVLRVRLLSVAFGLMTIIGIFWAGHSLGRRKTAFFSTLILIANPAFIYYARSADSTIIHVGWAMLAIAAALWAIRPLRPMPSTERQFLGWIGCGLALGAATLTAGPLTLVTVLAPIFLIILFCPDRVSHLIGLLASLLIGVLLVAPWLIYAHEQDPHVWEYWISSIVSVQHLDSEFLWARVRWRAMMLGLLFLPWILWLVAVIFQPLSRSSHGRRISLWLASGWAIGMVLLLIPLPLEPVWGDVLPITMPICLAIGQLFHHLSDMTQLSHLPRTWRWLRWPHTGLLLVLSVAVPWGLGHQADLIAWGYMPASLETQLSLSFIGSFAAILVGLTLLSVAGVIHHHPRRAVICWSFWCIVMATILCIPLARSQAVVNASKPEALQLAELLKKSDAFWIQRDVDPKPLDPTFLLYVRSVIQGVSHSQLDHALATLSIDGPDRQIVLVSPIDLQVNHPKVTPLGVLRHARLRLWRYK